MDIQKYKTVVLVVVFMAVCIISCKKEKYTPICNGGSVTYESEISFIINHSCMGSSCHNKGSERGDFSVYKSLQPYLKSGKFTYHVIEKQDMPRGNPFEEAELDLIQCWVENEFPER